MRRIAHAKQSFATPITQTIDLHCEQFDFRPVVQLGHSVTQKSGKTDNVILKLRQPTLLDLVEATFGNNEAALPVIIAIEQYEEFAVLKKTERLLRILLLLGNAHPKHINRNAELALLKTSPRLSCGVPPIRADNEIGAHF